MKCKAARILISAAADGEISKIEEIALDAHLTECVECRRERSSVNTLRRRLTVWEAQEPAESLADSFAMRLRREHESRAARRGVFVFPRLPAFGLATATAAVVLVLAFIGIAQRPGPELRQQATEETKAPVSGLHSRNTGTSVSGKGFPETTTTGAPPIVASIDNTKAATGKPAPAKETVSTASATHVAKRVRVARTWRGHRREATVATLLPRAAAAAGAVAVSKMEAARELVESAERLRSLVAEANITMEGGLLARAEPADTIVDAESEMEETPG